MFLQFQAGCLSLRRVFPLVSLFLVLPFSQGFPGENTGVSGGTISHVRYLCSIPLPEKDIERLTEIRPGTPLSPARLDRALKLLYQTRKYHRVEVEVVSKPEGLEVEFYLVPRRMIAQIKVRGEKQVKERGIIKILKREGIRPGIGYSEFVKSRIREIVSDFYRERGFPQVELELEEVFHPRDFGLTLVIHVREGAFTTVAEVAFSGDLYFPERKVREKLGIKPGDRLNPNRFAERVRKLKRWYRKQGLWEITVRDPEVSFPRPEGGAHVMFSVWGGRKVRIDFSGPTLHEKEIRDLRRMTRLEKDEDFSLGWVDEKLQEIEQLYRKRGRMFVKVSVEPEDVSQRERIFHFRVKKGPTIYIEDIQFIGNRNIDSATLRDQMLTNTRDLLGHLYERHNGIFLTTVFEEDLKAILFLYRKQGFSRARIVEVKKDIHRPDREEKDGRLALRIRIDEGVRSSVGEVVFTGNRILSGEEISRMVKIRVGEYLDPTQIEEGRKRLIEWYILNGFPNARVDTQVDFSSDNQSALVTYFIEEGMQVRLGKIVVSGTRWTRDEVIQREFHMREGDVYDFQKIVEGRRRLFGLGYLREVQAEPPLREIGADRWDLLVRVNEDKGGAFEMGGGYATEEGLRTFAALKHRNLLGTGRGFETRGEVKFGLIDWPQDFISTELYELTDWRIDLRYREPWLMKRNYLGKIDLLTQYAAWESGDYNYDLYRNKGIFGIEREFTRSIKGVLEYRLEVLQREYPSGYDELEEDFIMDAGRLLWQGGYPSDLLAGASLREPENEWLGIISPYFVFDWRDDIFNPTRGALVTSKIDISHPWLASDSAYLKFYSDAGFYRKIIGRVIGAFIFRAGYGHVFRETESIPPEERFSLGGPNSVRGFLKEEVGPDRRGKVLMNYQAEIRFPLPVGKRLGGVVFTDGGAVWEDPEEVAFGDVRNTAGVGLRYYTPIGPIRLDWGYKLDKEKRETSNEYHILIGNPF